MNTQNNFLIEYNDCKYNQCYHKSLIETRSNNFYFLGRIFNSLIFIYKTKIGYYDYKTRRFYT
jgi:hypothetical protein